MRRSDELWRNLAYAAFWPFFGLCFYALEWLVPGRVYHVMYHPVDDLIPFCELFLIPYLFWFVFMGFAYVYAFFADGAAFRRMMGFTILTYGGGLLMFVLYPTCQNLRPEVFQRDNVLTQLMAWFYTTDTSTNVCPSLHVCGSLAAAFGLLDTRRFSTAGWKRAILAVALTICVSTVFVKQHSILDMLWGFVFSGAAWLAVYGEKASENFRIPFLASRFLP
ncbi:MAG: phosphatase PAP2 family protein [Oscillospiraceae bacterium]|nr:phosphatase PAP2 family protein [Oscillospiraceae bacterium]